MEHPPQVLSRIRIHKVDSTPVDKMLSANSHQIDCRQKQVEYGSK